MDRIANGLEGQKDQTAPSGVWGPAQLMSPKKEVAHAKAQTERTILAFNVVVFIILMSINY